MAERDTSVSLGALFALFLKIGLSFGAGTGMSAVLQDELVRKRRVISRGEFMTIFGLARLVPSGTMTALAVAIGYRYQRLAGTAIVLLAMIAPGFALMVLATIAYTLLAGSGAMRVLNQTLMPAALALVVVSAFQLGAEFFTFQRRRAFVLPSTELALIAIGIIGVLWFDVSPGLMLVLGGVIGALLVRTPPAEDER